MGLLKNDTKSRLRSAVASVAAEKDIVKALGVTGATFSIGTEATNAIVVGIQLTDEKGDVDSVRGVTIALFADAAGAGFNATNYTTVAAGTDGALLEVVADKLLFAVSESDGDIDVSLTVTGAATCYLGVQLADGSFAISEAVTHA